MRYRGASFGELGTQTGARSGANLCVRAATVRANPNRESLAVG